MSVNRHRPHVLVLPEDDANRQLANGFLLEVQTRQIQILEEAGGWHEVLNHFTSDHVAQMDKYSERFMVLLIDLDNHPERLESARRDIREDLRNRVFILGVLTEPERLRGDLGSYETIGMALAKDCREGSDTTWSHELLKHNAAEVERLRGVVRGVLFPSV